MMPLSRSQDSHPSLKVLLTEVRAALFDFDGVIADTEPYQAESYARLLKNLGVHFSPDDFKRYVGHSELQIYKMMEQDYGIVVDVGHATKSRARYLTGAIIADELQPYPYIAMVLAFLDKRGTRAFIVSSNTSQIIGQLLRHWSFEDRFHGIYTALEFGESTTKPELIGLAADLIGHDAANLVLFEDSPVAVESASRLGIRTVRVINSMSSAETLEADVTIDPARYLGGDLVGDGL